MMTHTKSKAVTRWLARSALPAILEIEQKSFRSPWTEDDLLKILRKRNALGFICEIEEKPVGYVIYENYPTEIYIKNIAVHPDFRRLGVGKVLLEELIKKLDRKRRFLTCHVTELNLVTHLFLKAMDFRAVQVMKNYFVDQSDAYFFKFDLLQDTLQVA